MVAYAARDAEMTLALYDWLRRHYAWAIDIHSDACETPLRLDIASWIEPSPRTAPVAFSRTVARRGGSSA